MSTYETSDSHGWFLSTDEWSAIGGATGLMILTVGLMYAFAVTPLAVLNEYLFAVPILGVVVYGAAITGGELVAERGVDDGNTALAMLGLGVLLFAFGTFGAGILSLLPRSVQLTALGITAAVTTAMTALIGTYVYAREGTFEHYNTWATYAFLGGLGAVLIGSFFAPLLLVGFVLIFLGFLFRLGWEMWRIRDKRLNPAYAAIGLYVAVAGVFVHVLQIVVRMLARR